MKNEVLSTASLLIWQFWAPFKKGSEMREEKKELPELVLENSKYKRYQSQPIHNLSSHCIPLLNRFLRSLVSRDEQEQPHIERKQTSIVFLFSTLYQHLPKCCFLLLQYPHGWVLPRGWPITCRWQMHMQVIPHPLNTFCNSSEMSFFFPKVELLQHFL